MKLQSRANPEKKMVFNTYNNQIFSEIYQEKRGKGTNKE